MSCSSAVSVDLFSMDSRVNIGDFVTAFVEVRPLSTEISFNVDGTDGQRPGRRPKDTMSVIAGRTVNKLPDSVVCNVN